MSIGFTRRIHIILTIFAGSAAISNTFIGFYRRMSLPEIFDSTVIVPFITLIAMVFILLFLSEKRPKFVRFIQYFHITDLFLVALVATLDDYSGIYGLGFFFSGGVLALQYKLVSSKNRLAITLYFLVIISVVEFSALQVDKQGVSLDVLAFLVFFYAVLISTDSFRVKKFVNENKALKGERDKLKTQFDAAADMANYLDLPQVLSKRQMEIARLIYENQGGDKENAYEIGISVNTYRNHLKEIRRVLEVNSRVEVLGKVRPYFIAEETTIRSSDS